MNYHKNGETYWISLAINPILDGAGKLTHFVALKADVTTTKENGLANARRFEAIKVDYNLLYLNSYWNFMSYSVVMLI